MAAERELIMPNGFRLETKYKSKKIPSEQKLRRYSYFPVRTAGKIHQNIVKYYIHKKEVF